MFRRRRTPEAVADTAAPPRERAQATRSEAPAGEQRAQATRSEAPAGEQLPPRERRRGIGWHTRAAGAATAGAVGSAVLTVARLVMTLAALIALLIGLAIVLRLVDANQSNTIVKGIHDGANFFAGAFTGLISFSGHPKRAIAVNWGIALLAYLLVGALVSRAIARVGFGGLRYSRVHRPAV